MTTPFPGTRDDQLGWLFALRGLPAAKRAGIKVSGGGAHQSKTMMLRELEALLASAEHRGLDESVGAATAENLLGKASASASESSIRHLTSLYGLSSVPAVTRALIQLWRQADEGRPHLALLCALARDPLLRDTAALVLQTRPGDTLTSGDFEAVLERAHPGRFSPAMRRSLAQNCASSWAQSGHLAGKVKKVRHQINATPEAAAYATLLASLAGFGGPAILTSPWFAVLDASSEEQLGLLRRAQGRGLVRIRSAGGVFDLEASPELTAQVA